MASFQTTGDATLKGSFAYGQLAQTFAYTGGVLTLPDGDERTRILSFNVANDSQFPLMVVSSAILDTFAGSTAVPGGSFNAREGRATRYRMGAGLVTPRRRLNVRYAQPKRLRRASVGDQRRSSATYRPLRKRGLSVG